MQYIYDMSCRDRFHYYAVNPAEAIIFKAGSSISDNSGQAGPMTAASAAAAKVAATGPVVSEATILKADSGVSDTGPASVASVAGSEDDADSGWGWVIPCRFVWLDIVNVNQNSRDIVAELSILPEIYGSASRHVIAGFDCFSRGWCLFEIAMRNQALVQSEDPKVKCGGWEGATAGCMREEGGGEGQPAVRELEDEGVGEMGPPHHARGGGYIKSKIMYCEVPVESNSA